MPCPDALSGLRVLFLKVPLVMAPAHPNAPGACSGTCFLLPSVRPLCCIQPRWQARQHTAPVRSWPSWCH